MHRAQLQGNGKAGNILVIALVAAWLRQEIAFVCAASKVGNYADHLLHRLLGCYPRSASQCKAVADVDAHVQPEAVGLREGIVYHVPKVITQCVGLSVVFWTFLSSADRHEVAAT